MSNVALDSDALDLSGVSVNSATVVASPTTTAETIVASVTLPPLVRPEQNIILIGWLAYTAGTNGVTGKLQIRRTDASGTSKAASGLTTVVAASVYSDGIIAFDTGVAGGQVYVLTLQVGSASAGSTVSQTKLTAICL